MVVPILSLRNITKTYPGVVALQDFSLDFVPGSVHALLGENGAGKSTLIKTIAGAVQPDSGEIHIQGQQYRHISPAIARAHGIEVIYQEFNLVPTLSAAENICLGETRGKKLVDFQWMNQKARELFAQFEVDINPETLVRDLSSSQQQIVEIAKAVSKQAKVVIMDEPTAPLSTHEVESLFKIIRKARDAGTCIIYISHRLDEIFTIADQVSILRDGKFIRTVSSKDTNRNELISLMVGRELRENYPARQPASSITALELKDVSGNGDSNISFSLKKGEILGLAGLVGAGRTELAKLIFGAEDCESGQILINGEAVNIRSPRDAIRYGIGLIPENRKEEGCFLEQSIRWNISIAAIRQLSRMFLIDSKAENKLATDYSTRLQVKTPSLQQRVKNLSGGNQQKVVLAKTLATNSNILIFDEPTRGIDVGARQEIYKLMVELAAQGNAILMITSDMEELLGMSDRILVLSEGRMTGLLERNQCTQQRILELASGNIDKGNLHE